MQGVLVTKQIPKQTPNPHNTYTHHGSLPLLSKFAALKTGIENASIQPCHRTDSENRFNGTPDDPYTQCSRVPPSNIFQNRRPICTIHTHTHSVAQHQCCSCCAGIRHENAYRQPGNQADFRKKARQDGMPDDPYTWYSGVSPSNRFQHKGQMCTACTHTVSHSH
jgi:hypothetical protein